ncbi:hypothetical protein Bca52824_061883 [Brassica carinata]|uniref:Uncharacterized protein n=1 Tax=Brassica carinata TaxID=52824 RepID=A0A8X7QD38_BRACI|nr:hypothetical protein Bca52824_061883 [Brassica carinata]
MKTKHSPGEDPIIGFCKATSAPQETDLDNAVSGFLQGQLPPVKKQPLQRSRSRSPPRRIDSSVLRSKHYKMDADETFKTLDDDREPIGIAKEATHDEISHGEDLASMPDPI